jgi:hypothetical protein
MGILENRRFRRDVKQLEQFEQKWQELDDAHEYSELPHTGLLAIVVSSGLTAQQRLRLPRDEYNSQFGKNREVRMAHAEQIKAASDSHHRHAEAVILEDETVDRILDHVASKLVASMVFIGPGTATHAGVNYWGNELTWAEVARETTHLKLGHVDQMMYGLEQINGRFCVPLGTFAVSNPANALVVANLRGEQDEVENMLIMKPFKHDQSLTGQIVDYTHTLPGIPRYRIDEIT